MLKLEKQSGFTLLEVLLVVTIFAVVLASSFSLSNSQLFEDDLQSKILEVSALVERARNNSATGYRGDVWGIKVLDGDAVCDNSGDCVVLFKGRVFAVRDVSYDAFVQFDQDISGVSLAVDQENEFYFEYGSGWLSTTTTSTLARQPLEQQYIVLDNNVGDQQSVLVSPTGAISSFVCGEDQVYDSDGNAYNTVELNLGSGLGKQCWMAENLNVGTRLAAVTTDPTDNGIFEKWCYDDIEYSCDVWGGLYSWDEAMDYETAAGSQGICPSGWHIPSYATDFSSLQLGYPSGHALKIGGDSGFDILMSGMRVVSAPDYYDYATSTSDLLGPLGLLWTSGTDDLDDRWYYAIYEDGDDLTPASGSKNYGLSIRCLKDY